MRRELDGSSLVSSAASWESLVASLTNIGREWRSTATKMALVGMLTYLVLHVVRVCLSGELDDYILILVFLVFGALGIA